MCNFASCWLYFGIYLTLKITISWKVTSCSLTEIYRSLLRSWLLYHQGRSCASMTGGIGISWNVGTCQSQYTTLHPRGWPLRRAAQFITLLDWVTFCDSPRIASQLFGVSACGLSYVWYQSAGNAVSLLWSVFRLSAGEVIHLREGKLSNWRFEC